MSFGRTLIVGAGPCGIGCARAMAAAGRDVAIVEARHGPGGLASSVVDPQGFTWDLGGHVVFSHYGEFDRLLAETMGDELLHHERSSFVRYADRWIPYPFQNHLHHLPADLAEEATCGVVEAALKSAAPGDTFATWMDATFGAGVVRMFMRPYNEKVWAYPAEQMSAAWIAERVSVVPWREVIHALAHRSDAAPWGPNDTFAFPARGGTGEIYQRAAASLGDRVRYNAAVTSIDLDRRRLVAGGRDEAFDHLVWTGALDRLVGLLDDAPDRVHDAAGKLVHNSVAMVGIGYESPLADQRSWLYFPHDDTAFYRATNFAKYSPANVPGGRVDRYCSWMTEVSGSSWRPLVLDGLAERVDADLRRHGLVPAGAKVATQHVERIERAYPVPTVARDEALAVIQPWLMEQGIYSRGRFGAWKYELGNMDHAVKMGVDVARLLIDGTPEQAWHL